MPIQEYQIQNSAGLKIDFLSNGSIQQITAGPLRISLKASTPFSGAGANIYLRRRSDQLAYHALTGPGSDSRHSISENVFFARGSWEGIDYACTLQLSGMSQSWQWTIDLINTTDDPLELDLIYVQDIGQKPVAERVPNEYYVSQYLERLILQDPKYGAVLCCRQNMKEAGGHPWMMLACANGGASAATDGMQVYGKTYRETGIPECLLQEPLGGEHAGESSVLALQEKPFVLGAHDKHRSIFAATYRVDHPEATSADDLGLLPALLQEFPAAMMADPGEISFPASTNLFMTSPFMPVNDLHDEELHDFFGLVWRHAEYDDNHLLSFFYGQNNYVSLRRKEILADRPHGHIMQGMPGFAPDEQILSTTSFAFGVFHSHITQGNTNFNSLLSVCTSQFNQSPDSGQRIFVEIDGRYYMLGVPSAFEIGLNHCRWIYKWGEHCFQVRAWTSLKEPRANLDFSVLSGPAVRLIVTHQFDESIGWTVHPAGEQEVFVAKPDSQSLLASKFPKAQFSILINSQGEYTAGGNELLAQPSHDEASAMFVLVIHESTSFSMSFVGEVKSAFPVQKITDAGARWEADCLDGQAFWENLSTRLRLSGTQDDIAAIREILPWYGMNALTHFLTPYGLEQFSGAAWGTRDVSQGPVDLLLTMGKYAEARKVLCTIFSNQNPDGGWPQWWMFDTYSFIRADSAHGDIFYWCILALSQYIRVTGDRSILGEELPYYAEQGTAPAETTTLSEHVERLLQMIIKSFIPGTALVPFGGGDWNDSLQPVSKALAGRMISSWTVEMNYQAFRQYQLVQEFLGNTEKAIELNTICEKIKYDFHRHLVKDGIVAGYGLHEDDGSISVLLHPSDTKTGIHYSILPMNRGILSGLFSKAQAIHHQDIINQHLKGPDGARLMDRPLRYKGGIQEIFQRAESSTFFGREIGLMYVHEHIRYAESQAILGHAEEFVKALRQANPVAYRDIVHCGDFRQSNCYYSSSDVSFKSRYEADARYDEIMQGKWPLKGGWRVYSSGPGIYIGLVVTRLLGLRIEFGNVILDPVLPKSMDGLSASLDFMGHSITLKYAVSKNTYSPHRITVNGNNLPFNLEVNPYRAGGALFPAESLLALLKEGENIVEVFL